MHYAGGAGTPARELRDVGVGVNTAAVTFSSSVTTCVLRLARLDATTWAAGGNKVGGLKVDIELVDKGASSNG